MNDRLQTQEFEKPLVNAEAGYGSEQFDDGWNNICSNSVFSSNTLVPSHQNITTTGSLPYQQPPSDNVWNDSISSTWMNNASGVVLPSWSNSNDKWITSCEKNLCEPTSSVYWQHLLKHVKVSMIT